MTSTSGRSETEMDYIYTVQTDPDDELSQWKPVSKSAKKVAGACSSAGR